METKEHHKGIKEFIPRSVDCLENILKIGVSYYHVYHMIGVKEWMDKASTEREYQIATVIKELEVSNS